MNVHAIQAPSGLGKTTLVIDKIRNSKHKRVEFYVPTLRLAEEIHIKLKDAGVRSIVIRGRAQEAADGQTMCLKAPLANAIAKKGLHVFPVICMGRTRPGDKFSYKTCEHFTRCQYLAQFESDAQVAIFTHAYLPLPRNSRERGKRPTLIVIDESFLSVCLRIFEFSRSEILSEVKRIPETEKVVTILFEGLDKGGPLLDQLRNSGLKPDMIAEVIDYTRSSGASFNPFGSDEQLLKELDSVEHWVRLDILLTILIAELSTGRSESHGITYDSGSGKVRLHYRLPIERFDEGTRRRKTDVILIDANADSELLKQWFPGVVTKEIAVERNAFVVQCSSTRGATSSFVEERNQDAYSRERALANIEAVNAIIAREAEDPARKILIVGPQIVVGNPDKNIPARIFIPPNAVAAHFNGLRGVDAYKDHDGVIIIGRNQPSIKELESLARALWYDSPTPLRFAEDWVIEVRPYWMRNPADAMGMEVLVHPDPRIQKLHEQIREGESTQAIDRLRLIHTAAPKRVIVLSSVPLKLQVDELRTLNQLAYRDRVDQAWDELPGVMPLNPDWLAQRFPSLWPTANAAKKDFRAGRKRGQIVNNISINNSALLTFQYRLSGQRRHSHAVSRHPICQTRAELTQLLGKPIIGRAVVDGKPGPEVFGAMGAASFETMTASGTVREGL